jgi:hypothetical protein
MAGGTMYFQRFLKGIPAYHNVDDDMASQVLQRLGITCNWWRTVDSITAPDIQDKLTESNIYLHLERYDDIQPGESLPVRELTPFISTTGGVVERDRFNARNLVYPAFLTALLFATDWLRQPGYIYYGYLFTLGRKAIPFRHYAEEVRELNTYTSYLRFHDEGELLAKINIPSPQLQRVERWEPDQIMASLAQGSMPVPAWQETNPSFAAPEKYSNIREVLL